MSRPSSYVAATRPDLDPEVWGLVLSKLEAADVPAARLVCRAWATAAICKITKLKGVSAIA